MSDDEYQFLLASLDPNIPRLHPEHLISHLFAIQNNSDFGKTFDDTLRQISIENADVFSVKSFSGAKDTLFDELTQFISDASQRDAFAKALINKLFEFSFEEMFVQKYDFFATIFEYLIKDYNTDSGGKYAEYYRPHAVARIMAQILVPDKVKGVKYYDPSAGSGTLLMSLAHQIGEKNCTIYSEDISQKSSNMLCLNLGFITAQSGIEKKIRQRLISNGWLRGVVSMPSNIFASTGTNVSVLFFDKRADSEHIILMDASKLGKTVKEGKNQRTVLTPEEEAKIVDTFNQKQVVEDLSVVVTKEQIAEKNYSFSAGQYFEVKIEYVDITPEEFAEKMQDFETSLQSLFAEGNALDVKIQEQLKSLKYD